MWVVRVGEEVVRLEGVRLAGGQLALGVRRRGGVEGVHAAVLVQPVHQPVRVGEEGGGALVLEVAAWREEQKKKVGRDWRRQY